MFLKRILNLGEVKFRYEIGLTLQICIRHSLKELLRSNFIIKNGMRTGIDQMKQIFKFRSGRSTLQSKEYSIAIDHCF